MEKTLCSFKPKEKVLLYCLLQFLFFHLYGQDPVECFPRPTGNYSVGKRTFHLEDFSRRDLLNSKENRHISITTYYPTFDRFTEKTTYISDFNLLSEMMKNNYNHQTDAALIQMASFKVNSKLNAELISDKKCPLLIFSHGMGMSTCNYTSFFEEYASQGYVVVAIDHPYGGFTLFSNGQLASSRQDSALLNQNKNYLLQTIDSWYRDISFTINVLIKKSTNIGLLFSPIIDRRRIVAIGHSLGGNAAVLASYKCKKIKAAINMDGGTFSPNPLSYKKPVLTLRSQPVYSKEELIKKGRNQEDWEKMGIEIDHSFSSEMSKAKKAYEIKIEGSGHMSFSDAPYVLPDMTNRFGGKMIERGKCFRLIQYSINQFLEAALTGKEADFSTIYRRYPEASIKYYRN